MPRKPTNKTINVKNVSGVKLPVVLIHGFLNESTPNFLCGRRRLSRLKLAKERMRRLLNTYPQHYVLKSQLNEYIGLDLWWGHSIEGDGYMKGCAAAHVHMPLFDKPGSKRRTPYTCLLINRALLMHVYAQTTLKNHTKQTKPLVTSIPVPAPAKKTPRNKARHENMDKVRELFSVMGRQAGGVAADAIRARASHALRVEALIDNMESRLGNRLSAYIKVLEEKLDTQPKGVSPLVLVLGMTFAFLSACLLVAAVILL